jgi:hypothetical protein
MMMLPEIRRILSAGNFSADQMVKMYMMAAISTIGRKM